MRLLRHHRHHYQETVWKSLLVLAWILTLQPGTTTTQALRATRFVDLLEHSVETADEEASPHHDPASLPLRVGTTTAMDDPYSDIQENYVQQSLDHFRLEEERQFAQRYFYTDRFVQKTNATRVYAFLCVGGEGPALTKHVLVDSDHCTGDMIESARRLFEKDDGIAIHLYALEHRYYGQSFPTFDQNSTEAAAKDKDSSSPVTNKHLVYLSSRQAQADLAHFVAWETDRLLVAAGRGTKIPWITFGGSYPGMMAAYARLRFPHYIAAAISSSAPIGLELSFPDYNNHVAKALNDTKIGGSSACWETFVQGHARLVQLVQNPDNHAALAVQFGLCNATQLSTDHRNVEMWLGDGVTPIDTQSNDPSCTAPRCNIAKKCAAVLQSRLQGDSPVEALAKLERARRDKCLDLSWETNIAFLSDTTSNGRVGGWRSWLWQTCTEFGFYQVCPKHSNCPFGRGFHPLSQDLEICQRAFGVSPKRVASAVQESLQYYGGLNLATTRVLSINGSVDPWGELALRHSTNPDLPAFVVPGASHHFWTHPVKPTDGLEIQGARELIFKTIENWLDEIDEEWNLR